MQVLGSLDENMQRYGDMLTEQQRSVAVNCLPPPSPHCPAYSWQCCCRVCVKR